MTSRIEALLNLTLKGEMFNDPIKTEFDREDLFLPRQERESKRLCEFILNQQPVLTEYSKLTGFFNCDSSVVGDAFRRMGHLHWDALRRDFYCIDIDHLSTLTWQHATADYHGVLKKGIRGLIEEIDASMKVHTAEQERQYLAALKKVAQTLIAWAHHCGDEARALVKRVENPAYKSNLQTLADALYRVPEHPPASFYEAVLTIYICFSADPDSIGPLDRYLRPFYEKDLAEGKLTRAEAKEYLQELFLMLQAATKITNPNFTKGGESHFCIGGFLPDGTDGYCALSELILESMLELPTWIPQVTFRWTAKTPKEVFRHALDCERKDPHKRIAFQNDEKRMKAYTEICGLPFEEAVNYTTVGCNEPIFLGSIVGSTSVINFLHPTETLFHQKAARLKEARTFEEFYALYLEILCKELELAFAYDDKYNRERAKDINYLSGIFFHGCVEKAMSVTQGASDVSIASPFCSGIPNAIDSLIIVKQFVYDEKIVSMEGLIDALQNNWEGYEDLRTLILKKGDFFGNDTPRSNRVAQMLYQSLYEFLKEKTNLFGYHWLMGDLNGYFDHFRLFGDQTKATPDGRRSGDQLKFGLGQAEGKDRRGLSALLNSVANIDPNGIGCGSTITNVMIDEQLIREDEHFDKTVDLLETYFKNGGVHFQLNYVSKEDLLNAKISPEEYKNLRVRVSGFSEYFTKLKESLQDDIIARTSQR